MTRLHLKCFHAKSPEVLPLKDSIPVNQGSDRPDFLLVGPIVPRADQFKRLTEAWTKDLLLGVCTWSLRFRLRMVSIGRAAIDHQNLSRSGSPLPSFDPKF